MEGRTLVQRDCLFVEEGLAKIPDFVASGPVPALGGAAVVVELVGAPAVGVA